MVWNKIRIFLEMIKFEHTIFALPFAYLGMILAADGWPTFHDFFWITVAMFGARTFAMGMNRVIDKEIDAANPRTADRAIPTGLISVGEATIFNVLSFLVFIIAVYNLAPIARYLWPPILFLFVFYPYTKRFTWLCHFFLGFALGVAPAAAWIAIKNQIPLEIWVLTLAVSFWVAGFDIIYATLDYEIDKKTGLNSIPVRFSVGVGLKITMVLHILTIILLFLNGLIFNLGVWYYAGVLIALILLFYENIIVSPENLSKVNVSFFTVNGFISVIVFLFSFIDITIL